MLFIVENNTKFLSMMLSPAIIESEMVNHRCAKRPFLTLHFCRKIYKQEPVFRVQYLFNNSGGR